MNLDDKLVLLSAFVLALAAAFFLTLFVGAEDVSKVGIPAVVTGLAGALAALVKR